MCVLIQLWHEMFGHPEKKRDYSAYYDTGRFWCKGCGMVGG